MYRDSGDRGALRTLAQPPDIPTPPALSSLSLYLQPPGQDAISSGLVGGFLYGVVKGLYNDVAEDVMWVDVTLELENEISMM